MSRIGVQCGRRGSPGSDGRSLGTDEEGEESHVPMVLSKVLPFSRLELFELFFVWFTPQLNAEETQSWVFKTSESCR